MPAIGDFINARYEILEKSGEGGVFTVYRTRDKIANRLMAVKILKPEYVSEPDVAGQTVSRASQLLPLFHTHLTRVYDVQHAGETVYIAEEHVRGMDLKERIRRIAPFTVASGVDVAIGIASALDYLHRAGLTHGDLRPQKVLVGPEGEVKVTGAGLSAAMSGHDDLRSLGLMRAVHYSAPELFDGSPASAQTDIYALGIILYEMLTGSLPFHADSAITVATKHKTEPVPSARNLNAGIPRELDGIVMRAMAKEPEERYETAAEMLADLMSVQESLRIGRPAPRADGGKVRPDESEHGPVALPREESIWKGLARALLLVALVAAVVFAGITFLMGTSPGDVTVPDLTGLTSQQAGNRLSPMGLMLEVEREDYNEKYDEGEIYFSTPQSGERVKQDTVVRVYVSKGSKEAVVPDLVGMSESRAIEALQESDFVIGGTDQAYSSTVPAGSVVRQTPRSGRKAPRKSRVSLVVSLGTDPSSEEPEEVETTPQVEPDETEEDDSSPLRKLRVRFALPEGGQRKIQIIVKDETGEWTALDEDREGGEAVETTINATGKRVEIRTYVDGKLVDRQVK